MRTLTLLFLLLLLLGCGASVTPTGTPRTPITSSPTSSPVLPRVEDAEVANIVQFGALANGVETTAVRVQDRGVSGEPRVLMVTFRVDGFATRDFYSAIGAVAGAFYSANQRAKVSLDALVVAVSDHLDHPLADVTIAAADIAAINEGRASASEFVAKWKITKR